MTTDIYTKKVLIFGCGNTLFENDGFGPAVVEYIQANYTLPETVIAVDAGTGIRDFMFDLLLMDKKPETVIVIDAVTVSGRKKGEIFEMTLAEVPKEKLSDFSLHQSPSSNLLKELEVEGGVEVKVLGMHTDFIPNEINPGLTPEVAAAVPRAAQWVVEQVKGEVKM